MTELKASQAVYLEKLAATDVTEISADPELLQFATAGGASTFKVYCEQCHGSGAQGGPGYPNLNDDAWIWGGTMEDIYTTLMHGVRYEQDEDTRISDMPAFGRDELLERPDINDVAWYVRKISGQEFDEEAATRGEAIFADNCSACHGEQGEGMAELGAPQPVGCDLALWRHPCRHRRPGHKPPPGRDAGLGRPSRRDDRQAAGRLCPRPRRRPVGRLNLTGRTEGHGGDSCHGLFVCGVLATAE